MRFTASAVATAAFLCLSAGTAAAQSPRAQEPRAFQSRPKEEIARLYDSLSARPGWPAEAGEAEVDALLARNGLKPEDRRTIIAAMKQDVCRNPEMAPICNYVGAETIYKIQKAGWRDLPGTREGGALDVQMQLLEYGIARNLARLYAKGLTDAQAAQLYAAPRRPAAKLKPSLITIVWTLANGCGTHEQTLSDTGPFWQQYRLNTCGVYMGSRWALVVFGKELASLEAGVTFAFSDFARKAVVWWPTGADPSLCANSLVNGSANAQCGNFRWWSGLSFKPVLVFNSGPATILSTGSATRLNKPFSVTITLQ